MQFFILFLASVAAYFGTMWYFGFNETPQSRLEDVLLGMIVTAGFVGALGSIIYMAVVTALQGFEAMSMKKINKVFAEMAHDTMKKIESEREETSKREADLERATDQVRNILAETGLSHSSQGIGVVLASMDDMPCLADDKDAPAGLKEHHETYHCKKHKTKDHKHFGDGIMDEVEPVADEVNRARKIPVKEVKSKGKSKQTKKTV